MADDSNRIEGSKGLFWTGVTVVYAIIVLFPIFWMATMMVKPNEAMFARPTVWLFTPTLEHFEYVIAQGFHWSLLTSFVLCLMSTALVVIIGTPAAYAFARFEMRMKDDLFLFILATRMAPPVCPRHPVLFHLRQAQSARHLPRPDAGLHDLQPLLLCLGATLLLP